MRCRNFFKLCVATWQRHNPHWDVRIVSKSNIFEYLSAADLPNRFMQMVSHQIASDHVRLGLLSRYGGIYMDVNILMLGSLDDLCCSALEARQHEAAVFYHPMYGTDALGNKDLVESWFLATRPSNPFFIRWRDLLRELMHNRLDTVGLLQHPLYQGLDLSGINNLNREFGAPFDFREYLAIHAMCHRLLETEEKQMLRWRDRFLQIDAAKTAFRLQMAAQAMGKHPAEVLLMGGMDVEKILQGVPFIKFTTPHYGPFLSLSRAQLLNPSTALAGLLTRAGRPQHRVAMKAAAGSPSGTTVGRQHSSHTFPAARGLASAAGKRSGIGSLGGVGLRAISTLVTMGAWISVSSATGQSRYFGPSSFPNDVLRTQTGRPMRHRDQFLLPQSIVKQAGSMRIARSG